jgi:hypothetical protein
MKSLIAQMHPQRAFSACMRAYLLFLLSKAVLMGQKVGVLRPAHHWGGVHIDAPPMAANGHPHFVGGGPADFTDKRPRTRRDKLLAAQPSRSAICRRR